MTGREPLVSVLVPVYRRENLLRGCVESALAQTVPIEVVIADNASPDGTWDLCRTLAREDPRVRVFRNEENLGPVLNWKRCMDEARGVYGKLLFSDDQMAPDYLARTLPFLTDHPEVAFAFTAVEIGPAPGRGRLAYSYRSDTGIYSSRNFIDSHLMRTAPLPESPGAALFRLADLRRDLAITPPGSVDWLSTGAGPDVLLYLLAATRYPRIAYVAEPLCFFRDHPGSITASGWPEVVAGYRQALAWFASTHCDGWRRARALGKIWFKAMRVDRRLQSPGRTLARYGVRDVSSAMVCLAAAVEKLSHPFRREYRRRRPARR